MTSFPLENKNLHKKKPKASQKWTPIEQYFTEEAYRKRPKKSTGNNKKHLQQHHLHKQRLGFPHHTLSPTIWTKSPYWSPTSGTSTSMKKKSTKKRPLPTDTFSTASLQQFSTELKAFGAYVRLTRPEQQLRQRWIDAVSNASQAASMSSGSSVVSVDVFGSFATLPVCVYCSDVDVAVRGVIEQEEVPRPEASGSNKRAIASGSKPTVADRKRQRIEKWKTVLAVLDKESKEENAVSDNEETSKHSDEAFGKKSNNKKDHQEDGEDLPLFLVDRVGDDALGKDDDDDDSADKLEHWSLPMGSTATTATTEEDSLSNDDEGGEKADNSKALEVSFVAVPPPSAAVAAQAANGLRGRVREQVVTALTRIRNRLTKKEKKNIKSIMLIRNARVPIIKIESNMGIDIDIAISGHMGTDTSHFSAAQVAQYERWVLCTTGAICFHGREMLILLFLFLLQHSFATIVLFLKILLHEHNLDVPFEGGLGSYKLYVLVAYHIQAHVQLGGNDDPAETLLTFFYRYGLVREGSKNDPLLWTSIDPSVPLVYQYQTTSASPTWKTASADMSNVTRWSECIALFRGCWMRLNRGFSKQEGRGFSATKHAAQSLLGLLVNAHAIELARSQCQGYKAPMG